MTGEEALKKIQKQHDRQNKYNKENYERLGTIFKRGTAERIKKLGYESISKFLKEAVEEKLTREEVKPKADIPKVRETISVEVDGEPVEIRIDADGKLINKDIKSIEAYRLYMNQKMQKYKETGEISKNEQEETISPISWDDIRSIVGEEVMEAVESKERK